MMDFSKILDTRSFLAGVLLSFVGLSVAGWLATEENLFSDFHRSHQNISVETQFYPTARELVALVREKLLPDNISVIVAGSSVMRGNGQSQNDLWSSNLQKELGGKFQVINLAVNAGGPGGQGLYMTEWLIKQGRKAIFISDISIVGVGMAPDNGPTYRGLFFDAERRGYLNHFPERTARVVESLKSADPALLTEHRIKAYLNSYLNFNDLWTAIGYRYFFTVWTPLTLDKPWGPRGILPDAEPNCDPVSRYKNFFNEEMNIMRGFANEKPLGDEVDGVVAATIPKQIMPRTIFIVNRYSPYYFAKLDTFERERFNLNIEKATSKYRSLGITSVAIAPAYLEEDFCDRAHFSYSGGQKLAASLAPYIKQKAKELGYE